MSGADDNLLFGLIALQNGLIDQSELIVAFQAWTLDKARSFVDHIIVVGHLSVAERAAINALVMLHIKKHGDAGRSLAAMTAGCAIRESLAKIGDADVLASLTQLGPPTPQMGDDADRTASHALGILAAGSQRFRVLRPHASGGLGAVFVALDTELHREVALKQIVEQHADDLGSRGSVPN